MVAPPICALQVAAAPKKRPRKNTEEAGEISEEVKPTTPQEKVQGSLEDLLKAAAAARTKSITVGGLEFAEDLSKELLGHADHLEGLYKRITATIKSQEGRESDFKYYMKKIEEGNLQGAKMKASV